MKKIYLKTMLLFCGFLAAESAVGQTIKPVQLEPASAEYAGTQLSFLHYSPNLHHEHDHEHCLADVLTQDWIERAGIEEEYAAQKLAQNSMVARMEGSDRATYTIPVIFHVIYNTPAENVSEADIVALLDAVNEDFSATNSDIGDARTAFGFDPVDADIQFCLARQDESGAPLAEHGIHRVSSVEEWFDPDTETNKMKGSTGGDTGTEGWDRDRYLNVWICDITNGAGFGVAGYAYKPTIGALPPSAIDGIVIDTDLGMTPSNRVLTHEIGHFLGLDHPWGGGDGSCDTDDGLADTPNTAGPSFNFGGSCSGTQETCPGTQTQYENYMDYSNCTVMYTEDQANLMSLILDNSRADLTISTVCESPFEEAPVADFVADITTVVEGGSVNFTDLSENTPTSWAWTVTPAAGTAFVGGTSPSSENPVIQFSTAGFYTISLTATNGEGSDTETKTNYIEVVEGGGGSACDTSRNYTAAEYDNLAIYGLAGEAGYYPAHATLDGGALRIEAYAEKFNAVIPTSVKRLRFPVFRADDIGSPSNVIFRVWDDAAGEPGAVLGTRVVPMADLNAGFFNTVEFTGGIPVTGNYWVGAELSYVGGFDTLMFGTTNFADRPAGASTTSAFISGGVGWTLTSSIFASGPNCSLIMDVLTSNGPAPVAVVSFPDPAVTCEGSEVTMNGFGSLNTTSYYWDISDGTDDYFFGEANLTSSFGEGTWTIQLLADGACETDASEVFTLTVNPSMSVSPSTEPENCTASDGEIAFTVTGGSGGPFEYSINAGATFVGTSVFTGLDAGDYTYVIKDDENCEVTDSVTVENENTFAPTISPDITILPGASTDLTVTGGATWSWYAGADFVGSTATITVTPDVTTTYVCNSTDASGCEVTLEVTVTVIDDAGLSITDLGSHIEMYPNPTTGSVSLTFDFVQAKDLTVTIVNLLGEKVTRSYYTGVTSNTLSFDLSQMSSGVYFVNVQTETEAITKKLILKK